MTGVATAPVWSTLLPSDLIATYSGISATSGATIVGANAVGACTEFTTTGTGNVVLSTSPVLTTPNLGTPSAGTLTNCTIPIGKVTGLGTGVDTFLITPSSANLYSALTDSTGTGLVVFNDTPTLLAPILGTPTSGTPHSLLLTAYRPQGFCNFRNRYKQVQVFQCKEPIRNEPPCQDTD